MGPEKYFGLGPGKAIIQPWIWPWFGPHCGLRALGVKSVINDCLVTIARCALTSAPCCPLMSESWRRPCF